MKMNFLIIVETLLVSNVTTFLNKLIKPLFRSGYDLSKMTVSYVTIVITNEYIMMNF